MSASGAPDAGRWAAKEGQTQAKSAQAQARGAIPHHHPRERFDTRNRRNLSKPAEI